MFYWFVALRYKINSAGYNLVFLNVLKQYHMFVPEIGMNLIAKACFSKSLTLVMYRSNTFDSILPGYTW